MSEWEPKIVAFLCNWCSYGAADLAGVSRMQYPPNIRVIRIPCTGRIDPTMHDILLDRHYSRNSPWQFARNRPASLFTARLLAFPF